MQLATYVANVTSCVSPCPSVATCLFEANVYLASYMTGVMLLHMHVAMATTVGIC